MKIIFIRHGEPDYSEVTQKKFIGHGRNLAGLTEAGKEQARQAAENPLLDGIELIVSSPYTRALQTAAIISKYKNIEIEVELDLHEWLPDLTHTFNNENFIYESGSLMLSNKGKRLKDSAIQYEELQEVFDRASKCLKKYSTYKKIAVTAHAILIRQFAYKKIVPYCDFSEIEFNKDFEWCGWIDNE